MLQVFVNTLSDIGGLFASVGSIAGILIGITSQGDFVAYVTKKLFLARRYQGESATEVNQVVASDNLDLYNRLKSNAHENKVDR